MYTYNYNISSYGYLACEKLSFSQYLKQDPILKIKVERKKRTPSNKKVI
jgi:hypothetical protein